MSTTWLVLNPGSTAMMRNMVRSNKPAPVMSSKDNANCAATSVRVSRWPKRVPVVRPAPAIPICKSRPLNRNAGRTPASRAANIVAATAIPRTRASGLMSSSIGSVTAFESAGVASNATATPRNPPTTASTAPSIASCRINRPRPAPSAARVASSVIRDAPRASSRLATFTEAISITTPTTASASESGWPNCCRNASRPCAPGATSILKSFGLGGTSPGWKAGWSSNCMRW